MIVSLDGHRLSEAYLSGVSASDKHDVRSATKSITAILVGELLEDGLLETVQTPLAEILPARFVELAADNPKRLIALADALTMRTGLACDDWVPASVGNEDKMYETRDWTAFVLDQPIAHEPGKHFSYCTGGVILIGEAIEALTGRSVASYANERLFQPIGAEDVEWAKTPSGGTDTGGHLRITASSFHQVGVLIANEGIIDGNRILREQWLNAMTGVQIEIHERRQEYGYLWWSDEIELRDKSVRYIYAHGNGGNFLFVVPDFQFVASFTGVNFGNRLQFQALEIFESRLLPTLVHAQHTSKDDSGG